MEHGFSQIQSQILKLRIFHREDTQLTQMRSNTWYMSYTYEPYLSSAGHAINSALVR